MKNEQVVPNYKIMLETSFTLLALVASGWLLIKLISACFWLPGFLKTWQIEEAALDKKEQLNDESKDSDEIDIAKDFGKNDDMDLCSTEELKEAKKDK